VVAKVLARYDGAVQEGFHNGFRGIRRYAVHHSDSLFREKLLCPLPHAASNDDFGALLVQPSRQQSRLVGRRG